MAGPQQPSPIDRSDTDDVEQRACPKCDAQPGSPCRSRGGALASAHHTRRFTTVPWLKKALRVPAPAGRAPGRPWRPWRPQGVRPFPRQHLSGAAEYAKREAYRQASSRPTPTSP
ncbi:zinc finger domain-containing protein [Streptomyces litmocidini]|uniref:zinc finger domain-containing protein n=1 Tax=Streptomyces litmocidini TaxID=67318 RepID=UPI003F541F3F